MNLSILHVNCIGFLVSFSYYLAKSRTVRKWKLKANEDIEAQTQDIADETEHMILINLSDKKSTENESIGRDAYTGIETNPLFKKFVEEKNNRSSMSETSHDKNETLSLTTQKSETKDKENMESMTGFVEKTAAKELSVAEKIKRRTGEIEPTKVEKIERTVAIEPTKVDKVERTGAIEPTKIEKIERTTAIEPTEVGKIEQTGAIEPTKVEKIDRTVAIEQTKVEKFKITRDIDSTLFEKKTSLTALPNEKDEAVTQIKQRNDDTYSNTVSTKNIVSGIPVASSLKTKDVTNKYQSIETDNESQVETWGDVNKGLTVHDTQFSNMNISDDETYNIQVSRLAEYVAKKENASYRKEFKEVSSKGVNFKNQSKDLASSDMNILKINCTRIGLPIVLEDDPSANINANYIDAGPFEQKKYIAFMGPPEMSMSCKRAFWKTVLQERCGTIVMLTHEDLPEDVMQRNLRRYHSYM